MGRMAAALLFASTAALVGAVAWGAASHWSPAFGLLTIPLVANAGIAIVLERQARRSTRADRELQRLAGLDPLTQVATRATFGLALADTLGRIGDPTRGRRTGDATGDLAVLVLEVGSATSEGVLKAAARLVEQTVRPDDVVARLDEREFAVIAPGAGSAGARRLGEALEVACARVSGADGEPLGATVAWALHPSDGSTAAALVEVAGDRLLATKRSAGRKAAGPRALAPRARPV
jgi:GGDEF domain-containing protein